MYRFSFIVVNIICLIFIGNLSAEIKSVELELNLSGNDSVNIDKYKPDEPDGNEWKKLNDEQKNILTEGITVGIRAFYSEIFSFPENENLFRDSNFTKRLAVQLGNDPKNAQEEDSSLLLMMLETLIKFSPREQLPISVVSESISRFYDNNDNLLIPVSYAYKYCVFTMNIKENIVNSIPEERLKDYVLRLRKFYNTIHDEKMK